MGGYEVHIDTTLEAIRTGLVDALGQGKAHYEPAKVSSPGVWIHFLTVDVQTLAAAGVELELVLAVPSSDPLTVAKRLSDLWNTVTALYGRPDGRVRTQTTIFPDSPSGRPSLVLPYIARI